MGHRDRGSARAAGGTCSPHPGLGSLEGTGGSRARLVLGCAMLLGEGMPWEPPAPPPHRGGGGHCKPAQDAGQGVGCFEGRPLDPHVLRGGQQSACALLPIALGHPWLPCGAGGSHLPFPWTWDHHLPHPRAGDPPSLLHPPSSGHLAPHGPPSSPRPSRPGVLAAPTRTHCKFIVWVLRAFLEGPRVAELLDVVGFIETAGEGRGRGWERPPPPRPLPGGAGRVHPAGAAALTW